MGANRPQADDQNAQLRAIHDNLVALLEQLDALDLHHAAAHVSTALDSIRRDRWPLPPSP